MLHFWSLYVIKAFWKVFEYYRKLMDFDDKEVVVYFSADAYFPTDSLPTWQAVISVNN